MKELSIEQKAKAYDEALGRMKSWVKGEHPECFTEAQKAAEYIFPELKESEGELTWLTRYIEEEVYSLSIDIRGDEDRIKLKNLKKSLAWLEKQGEPKYAKKDVDDAYLKGITDAKNETEKQYEANYQIRKDIATFIFNYRSDLKDRAKWMDYLGIKVSFVEEQGKQNTVNPQSSLKPKSALEAWKAMRFEVYQQASGNRHGPNCSDDTTKMFSINDIDEIFEKICEQNPADKVEPRFHEGEWVVTSYGKVNQVVTVDEDGDGFTLDDHTYFSGSWCDMYHLWSIKDAKSGDVLACNGKILLFKSYSVQGRISLYCWYNEQTNNFHDKEVVDVLLTTKNKVCPATKEQRDLLISKMIEVGYKWDADKKELKKIEDEPENYKQQIMSEITDLVKDYIKQKPTWNKEDEENMNNVLYILNQLKDTSSYEEDNIGKKTINWLKSLKQRIGG